MITKDLGPYVGLGRFLNIRMPELENNLRLRRRKTIGIRNASAQDERVVVQPEVLGIHEQNLPDFEWCVLKILGGKIKSALISRRLKHLTDSEEDMARHR